MIVLLIEYIAPLKGYKEYVFVLKIYTTLYPNQELLRALLTNCVTFAKNTQMSDKHPQNQTLMRSPYGMP